MHQVPAWLRILVAGWPAVAFLGGTLLAHSAPTTTTADTEEIEDQEDAPAPEDAPEPTPVPPAQPATVEPPPERPAIPVPAALVEHARKVADQHRTRAGSPIDTPTLRARLGARGCHNGGSATTRACPSPRSPSTRSAAPSTSMPSTAANGPEPHTTYVLAHWVFAGTGLSDTEAWLAASLEPAPGTEGEPTK